MILDGIGIPSSRNFRCSCGIASHGNDGIKTILFNRQQRRDAGVPTPATENHCSYFRGNRNYSLWLPPLVLSSYKIILDGIGIPSSRIPAAPAGLHRVVNPSKRSKLSDGFV